MSDQRRKATLTITGDFTEGELGAFVALVRHIDSSKPDRHFDVTITDVECKFEELEPLMRKLMPEVPGRTTPTISVHRKQ